MYKITEKQFKEMPVELQALYEKLPNPSSDEVVSLFPHTKSGGGKRRPHDWKTDVYGMSGGKSDYEMEASSGSASRFFYCAKASKKERNMGCEGLEEKKSDLNSGGIGRQCSVEKRLENGDGINAPLMKNNHPTVKPIALMEYLIKLVSREGAVVLDPFAGSGSTLIACQNLNRQAIGIEREAEYIEIIKARTNNNN